MNGLEHPTAGDTRRIEQSLNQHRQRRAPVAARAYTDPRRDSAHPFGPGTDAITIKGPGTQLAERRIAQVNTARPPPGGPGGHLCQGAHPGPRDADRHRSQGDPAWPTRAHTEPGGLGPRRTDLVPR